MTQLSRERLEQYAFDDRMCNVNGEIREMARLLLAAEAQEPVAWTTGSYVQNRGFAWGERPEEKSPVVVSKYWDIDTFGGNEEWLKEAVANTGAKPLYAAPQPVAVPDEIDLNDPALDTHRKWMAEGWNRCRAAMLQPSSGALQLPDRWKLVPVEPTAEMISSGIAAHYERSQIQIHDRPAPGPMECAYVAMLAAAPVNPEFTTQSQWISCSERMPKKGEDMVWVHTRNGCITPGVSWEGDAWYWDDDVFTQEQWGVTHWMPMVTPPPPQEPTK